MNFRSAEMLPAVGQGIVAVECAAQDWQTRADPVADRRSRCACLRRRRARGAVGAQRPLQFADRGLCRPSAARQMSLTRVGAGLMPAHASSRPRVRGPADRPRELGRAVGLELLAKGAAEIIERSRPVRDASMRLVVTVTPDLTAGYTARTRFSICSTWAIGVSGWMPWPRLKISRPLREIRQHVVDRAVERGAAGDQRQRIEIALHGDAALHALADQRRLRRPVDADGIDAGCLDIAGQQSRRRRAESR